MRSPKPLTVDVFELARERRLIEGELNLDALPRLASSVLRADRALQFRIRGEVDQQSHPGAELHLRGDLVLQCQRCNSEMQYPLRRDVHFRFVGSDEELAALPIVDDDVEVIVGSHTMAWRHGSKTRRSCLCRSCRVTRIVERFLPKRPTPIRRRTGRTRLLHWPI